MAETVPAVSVNIGQDIVKPIVAAKIAEALTAAMGDSEKIIRAIVDTALNVKVDNEGKVSSYSHYNNKTLIEHYCHQEIAACAKAAVQKWIESSRPTIEAAVVKELNKSSKDIAKTLVQTVVNASSNSWRLTVDVGLKAKD